MRHSMPRGGPLYQILSTCRVEELKEIQKEYAPRIKNYDSDKQAFVKRLRNSLNRSIEAGEVSYEDIMNTLRDELEEADRRQATTRIRDAVNAIELTSTAGLDTSSKVQERVISAELCQVLRQEFTGQPYDIVQEYYYGRGRVDLAAIHESNKRTYAIELKRAGSSSRERTLSQVRRYRDNMNGCRRVFAVFVIEDSKNHPQNHRGVSDIIEYIQDEPRAEVLLIPPGDVQYSA